MEKYIIFAIFLCLIQMSTNCPAYTSTTAQTTNESKALQYILTIQEACTTIQPNQIKTSMEAAIPDFASDIGGAQFQPFGHGGPPCVYMMTTFSTRCSDLQNKISSFASSHFNSITPATVTVVSMMATFGSCV